MDDILKKQLTMQIEQQLEAKVVHVKDFTIPYSIVNVSYIPIIKKRMDILMKMLLTSFESGAFTKTEQLASILMVEPLFINDLTRQMERSKLILNDESYTLTEKGKEQLRQGIYEEQLPEETIELVYSALHEKFFAIDVDEIELNDDLPDPTHYFEDDEDVELNEGSVVKAIEQHLKEEESERFLASVEAFEVVELYDFPIMLFVCYDQKADRYFSRAFNLYINEWDEMVAKFFDEKEVVEWRKAFQK